MKQKLFTILTLLLCLCSTAWADDYPTYNLMNSGSINSTDFFTAGTETDGTELSSFTKYVAIASGANSAASLCDPTKLIAYDVKSTQTEFTITVYNSNSSGKTLYIHDCKEVLNSSNKATTSTETKSVASKKTDATNTVFTYTTNNTGKATIYFSTNSGNIHFYQITAVEKGTALTNRTPSVGYSLNLAYGRIASQTAKSSTYDGIEFCVSSDYKPTNNSDLRLKTFGTHYVKFTLTEPAVLKLKVGSNVKYTLGTAKNAAGSTEYGGTSGTTYSTLLTAGTWYINPIEGNTSDFKITNIAFDPAYAVNFNAGEGGTGTMSSVYYEKGKTVKVPACTFTHATMDFDKWSVTGVEGITEAVEDDEFTMPENNVTLTALWKTAVPKHSVNYVLNGATGDAPTQSDVSEGAKFEVASIAGLTAPEGMYFVAWNDGSDDYAPGDKYTMGTSDVTLTAQWASIAGSAIIKVPVTGASTHGTITGSIGGTATVALQSASESGGGYKFGKDGSYISITLSSGETFKTGDVINVHATVAANNTPGTLAIYNGDRTEVVLNTGTLGVAGDNIFVLPAAVNGLTSISVYRSSTYNWNGYVDYIEVTRPNSTISLNASGYATYSAASDFTVTGAKAYKAALNTADKKITCTEVEAVPAGAGVLLFGDANAQIAINNTTGVEALTGNDLKGTTLADGTLAALDNTKFYYALSGDTFKHYTGTAFVAGKAYFESDTELNAKAFALVFDEGETTAINGIEEVAPVTKTRKVVKNGRLVIETANGEYSVSGARVK